MNSIEFFFVGLAHTPHPRNQSIPKLCQGPASIEIFPQFQPALDGLEDSSHIWVIPFFDKADRILQARPRKYAPNAPQKGVFSMRSPVRPNPLGLSSARILELLPNTIIVDRLDLYDQTPIIDIKPYSPGWDLIPSANNPQRFPLHNEEDLRKTLNRDAENALGPSYLSSSLIQNTIDGLAQLAAKHQLNLRAPTTRFVTPQPDERVDMLLCAAGATFGNQRLSLASLPSPTLLQVNTPQASYIIEKTPDGTNTQLLPTF